MTTSNEHNNAPAVPQGWKLVQTPITEEMHVAAAKVLHRAPGLAGLPQRMLDAMLAATPAPAPAQECGNCFEGKSDMDHDCQKCGGTGFLSDQEVGLTNRQFDMICQAIDKADTVTMDGDYMLDSDDCIRVVRVMQVLLGISALRAKGASDA